MYYSFLERLAIRQTGRMSVEIETGEQGRIVVYPENIDVFDFGLTYEYSRKKPTFVLPYIFDATSFLDNLRLYITLIAKIIRLSTICRDIDILLFPQKSTMRFGLLALVIARLMGLKTTLYDYRYLDRTNTKQNKSNFYSLCDRVILGDTIGRMSLPKIPSGCVLETIDCNTYATYRKERAVPKVIVAGDFGDPLIVSLIRRVHELVKQKYPRTEFTCVDLLTSLPIGQTSDYSLRFTSPADSSTLRDLYKQADTLLLLSPGGLNRRFVVRAIASGFPIITNGFTYPVGPSHYPCQMVVRNSFTSMANAIIALVDDEQRYRRYSSSTLS